MNFSRYKSEHVADFLRDAILQGTLTEPLPGLREWSVSLGVSMNTLQSALAILKREGYLYAVPKKGFFLSPNVPAPAAGTPRLVRMIKHSLFQNTSTSDSMVSLSARLAAHQIGFQIEYWSDSRIRTLPQMKSNPGELLMFSGLSLAHQKLIERFKNALLIGLPLPGIHLPYISCDIYPAIRHAIHHLLRHGCERVDILNLSGQKVRESIDRLEQEFRELQQQSHRPFAGGVTLLPNDYTEQCRCLRNLASRVRGRQGLVVNSPINPGFVMMVLQSCGLKVPGQMRILPVNSSLNQLAVYPPLEYYPYPREAMARAVTKAAIHYFEAGALPELRTLIPLSLVPAPTHFPSE